MPIVTPCYENLLFGECLDFHYFIGLKYLCRGKTVVKRQYQLEELRGKEWGC